MVAFRPRSGLGVGAGWPVILTMGSPRLPADQLLFTRPDGGQPRGAPNPKNSGLKRYQTFGGIFQEGADAERPIPYLGRRQSASHVCTPIKVVIHLVDGQDH